MSLSLSLILRHTDFAPGEPVRVELVLENHGAAPLPVPDLDSPAAAWPVFTLVGPGPAEPATFALGQQAAADAGAAADDLEPGMDRDVLLTVSRRADTDDPGWYRLSCAMPGEQGELRSNTVRFHRERAVAIAAAAAPGRGMEQASRLACFSISRGDDLRALSWRELNWDEDMTDDELLQTPPERLAELDPYLCGPVSTPAMGQNPEPLEQWVAWIAGGRLNAGTHAYGFLTMGCCLPLPGATLAGPLLPRADGGCEALLLGQDRDSLALVSFDRPQVLEPGEAPPEPATADAAATARAALLDMPLGDGLEGATLLEAPSDLFQTPAPEHDATSGEQDPGGEGSDPDAVLEDDEDFDPLENVRISAPRLQWVQKLSGPVASAAAARGVDDRAEQSALVLVSQQPDCLELRCIELRGEENPGEGDAVFLQGVEPLAGSAPAVYIDDQGRVVVALLALGPESAEDPGRPLILARATFDARGRPLVSDTAIRSQVATLEREVMDGCASFYIAPEGPPQVDWLVSLAGGGGLAGRLGGEERSLNPGHTLIHPPCLLSFEAHAFAAAQDMGGRLRFVSLLC